MDQHPRATGQFVCPMKEHLGKGFSSHVYKGVDKVTGVPVVFKVIDSTRINTHVMEMLATNEIRALQIMDHPYVLRTYAIERNPREILIVCEYCPGGDLMQDVQRQGAFPENEALDILAQIARGVNYIHSLSILHRDLKTSNILIAEDGNIRITDFGFCEFVKERPPGHKLVNVGSPLYMSPEAYRNNIYSAKSDTWGLGVILYEMLIGKTPFLGLNYDSMVDNIRNGSLIRRLPVSDTCKKILFGLLQVDAGARWDTSRLLWELGNHQDSSWCRASGKSPKTGIFQREIPLGCWF